MEMLYPTLLPAYRSNICFLAVLIVVLLHPGLTRSAFPDYGSDARSYNHLRARQATSANVTSSNSTRSYPSNPEPRFAAIILDYYPAPIQINPANGHYIVQVYPSLHLSGTASNSQIRIRMLRDYSYLAGSWGNLAVEVMDFGRINGSLAVAPNGGAAGTLREVVPVDYTLGGANGALLDLITAEGLVLDTLRNFSTYKVGEGSASVNDENSFISLLCRNIGLPIPDDTISKLQEGSTFAAWWAPKFEQKPNAIYLSDEFGPLRRWTLDGDMRTPKIVYDRLGLHSLISNSSTSQRKRSLPQAKPALLLPRAVANQFARPEFIPPALREVWPWEQDRVNQLNMRYMPPVFPAAEAVEIPVEHFPDLLAHEMLDLPDIDQDLLDLFGRIDQDGLPNVLPEAGFAAAADGHAAANLAPDDPIGAIHAAGEANAHRQALDQVVPDFPQEFPPPELPHGAVNPIRENGPAGNLNAQELDQNFRNVYFDMNDPAYGNLVGNLLDDVDSMRSPTPSAEQVDRARSQLRDLNWLANSRAYGAIAAQAVSQSRSAPSGSRVVTERQAVAQEILGGALASDAESPYRRYLTAEPRSGNQLASPNQIAALNQWEPHLSSIATWGPADEDGYVNFLAEESAGDSSLSAAGNGREDEATSRFTGAGGDGETRRRPASEASDGAASCKRQRISKRTGRSAPCVSGSYDLEIFKKSPSKISEASLLVHKGVNHVITNLNPEKLVQSMGALGVGGIALGVVLVIVDWSPKMGYAPLAFGLAGAIAGTIVAALAPSGPIGWIIGGIVDAIFTILGGLLTKKPPPPGISNSSQIIQFAFFGDREHTGNEKCQAQADEAASQNDCAKAGLSAGCNNPQQCQVVYGAGYIAAGFGWMIQHSIAFLTWANNGHGMTIPDMAAKLAIFKSQDEADRNGTAIFYVVCDNHDPKTCQKAQFKLRHNLITIPHVNATADVVYDRLVDKNNKGDCTMLYDTPNGFALPDVGLTVYGRPYGFACGLSETHNFTSNATYRPTDIPIYGNKSGLAGDSPAIAPAYSLSSNNSNGEAGQGHVDAAPPTPFAPLTADNSACFGSLCVPSGSYFPYLLRWSSSMKVTVPKSGGMALVTNYAGQTRVLAHTKRKKKRHDLIGDSFVLEPAVARDLEEGERQPDLQRHSPLIRRNADANTNPHDSKARPKSINVTLTQDPACACFYNDLSFKGDKIWCFGVGGGSIPDEAGGGAKSLAVRGGAKIWLYLDHYNDNTAGAPYTTDVEDLTKVLLGDGTAVAKSIKAMWVKGP